MQFYDTYSTVSFCQLLETTKLPKLFTNKNSDKNSQFVPIQLAQIPYVLFSTGWSNHQLILNRCKSAEERLFYIIYSKFEHLEYKQLEQAIKTDTMASILRAKDSQSDFLHTTYTKSPAMFKDTAYLDFLGLPKKYKETRLRKGIVEHMKEFILEMGKDFLFIDEEHPIKVGGKTYKVDLLFYHRQLQCMVAFELLCKESDMETVRFALNRSMSPMMIMQYKEQLKVGGVIQRSIEEYCKYINTETEKNKTRYEGFLLDKQIFHIIFAAENKISYSLSQ